jgi:hypothetical protein
MSTDSFYNDEEFDLQKGKIDEDINSLVERSKNYDVVVFPLTMIGTGLAKLPEKAPRTFDYLVKRLEEIG